MFHYMVPLLHSWYSLQCNTWMVAHQQRDKPARVDIAT